ncbi:hypothetical protein N7603_04895 [Acholeplasma vituli]|uniref:Thioredoxin domain-containing protein n=1 Tax=Paracholeplasma vituli TaxID=69473 RepID=A0ABT2PXD4_9MOLU|nr:hypothetical protein [Paracholeplasma vituli]MCU0104989.1 hypothetical protein [Paracholeplasma vituli]
MSKKAYARPQYKVKPAVIIIVAAIVFLFAAVIVLLQPTDQQRIYNAYDVGNSTIKKDHVFESISASKLAKLIEKGDPIVVFFGDPSCSVCVSEIGWYDQEFKDAGLVSELSVIYYVKFGSMTEASKQTLRDKFGMALTETPEVYYLNEGEIVSKRKDFTTGTMAGQIKAFFTLVKNDLQ